MRFWFEMKDKDSVTNDIPIATKLDFGVNYNQLGSLLGTTLSKDSFAKPSALTICKPGMITNVATSRERG